MNFIKGNFKRYIFKSDKGYVVGLFRVKDCSEELDYIKNKTITFTGYFTDLNESDTYLLYGNIIQHEKYGEQFNATSFEIVLPEDKDNIIDFLSSDLFPGVGEKKSTKIVEILGLDCLNIIISDPNILLQVPTITNKQKETIYNSLVKYQSSYQTIVELISYGLSMKDALIIYNKYKEQTLSLFLDNPYRTIDDIYEISYKKIEKIRNNLKISLDNPNRVEASIKYVFNEVSFSLGNTYLSYEEIINYTRRVLQNDNIDLINEALSNLIEIDEVICEDDKYYLRDMYEMEDYIANRIFNLANTNSITRDFNFEKAIEKLEKELNISYNKDQKEAIEKALYNNFLVITGGPGTGKTTIINAICKLYKEINSLNNKELIDELALLAPTGRASKRMSEQTNYQSYTIHRYLKWNKEDNTFRVNEENPSEQRIVIVDESSMIDTNLFYNLLLGLQYNTKIIMIGDFNQLPSVGPGQILKDIIESNCVDVIKLEELYRQEEGSSIALLAHDIINNNVSMDIFDVSDNLSFIHATNENMKDVLKNILSKDINYKNESFQVLAPIYKGDNGIDDLNYFMQNIFNPKDQKKNEMICDGVLYRENDKVLQLINMVDENVFNGDIGKVIRIENNKKQLYVDYDMNIVKYTPMTYQNIKLGYAISIHKSQGSEFDVIIIPIVNKYNNMLYKKLIYTGITRAKKKLILVGEEEAFKRAINNDRENSRKTSLKNFICRCIK